ncbi:hypothetical protein FQN54_006469 [Arachnomyces sp. PD_36]|nr:hypothetical protein FQN54_006469 [Arachnomyces sp. PD_36]
MVYVGLSAERISKAKKAGYVIVLYLGLPRESRSGGSDVPSADIYLSYSEEDGGSNIWIGDLHMDDIKRSVAASPTGEMVSWDSFKDKINDCYETHTECQRDAGRILPRGFRVIDVDKRCIVQQSNCRFVALSYVWGLNTDPSLLSGTRATIDGMRREGGLPVKGMPATIENAMTVCRQMGERYLWADRLCIIQDDGDDKKSQIEAMDDIYTSAQIVLVAVYGDNMDFGIPGISYPREVVQRCESIQGLRITNILREPEDDPLCIWDTRGWTYQEAVLSRRRLYFTNTRAFFECERLIYHEDPFNAEEIRDELISTRLVISEDTSRFQSFTRHLRHYTSRNLTYRSDAYKALYGIFKSLYGGTNAFISGLPRVDFDHALLWYPDIGNNPIIRQEHQGITLPTWSWSSVMGLSDQVHYQATSFFGSLVPWYYINGPSSAPGVIQPLNIHSGSHIDDDWQTYMALACSHGCVENASFTISLEADTFQTIHKTFTTQWKDYPSFRWAVLSSPLKETHLPHTVTAQTTKPSIIATRTQTVFLRLALRPSYSFDITNPATGEPIGELCGDAAKLREEASVTGYDASTEFEFIALSLSGRRIMSYSAEELEPKNYTDSDGKALERVPVVNVLMVGRRGNGDFAYRRELGWVYLVDWVKLRREWRVVVLE